MVGGDERSAPCLRDGFCTSLCLLPELGLAGIWANSVQTERGEAMRLLVSWQNSHERYQSADSRYRQSVGGIAAETDSANA